MPKRVVTTESGSRKMGTPAFVGALALAGIVIIGGAIFLGRSDSGEINVAAAIQNSNQAAIENGGDPNNQIETTSEAFRNMPNGGLVPSGSSPQPQAETPVEETEAPTTTEATEEGEDEQTDTQSTEEATAE